MKKIYLVLLALFLVLLVAGFLLQKSNQKNPFNDSDRSPTIIDNSPQSKDVIYESVTPTHDISVVFPAGAPSVVVDYIQDEIDTFAKLEHLETDGEPYVLRIDYKKFDNPEYESYVLGQYSFTGGVNGNELRKTFVFDKLTNTEVNFVDFFNDEERVDVLTTELSRLLGEKYGESWFKEGITPESGNLENVYVTNNAIGFAFPEYAVAPGVEGAVDIEIPFDFLSESILQSTSTTPALPTPEPIPAQSKVNNFDECVAETGLIAESYPRQCFYEGQTFVEEIDENPIPGDGIELTVNVGPEEVPCEGVGPQACLMVDGQLFYDGINGFTHEEGFTYRLKIKRTLAFGTDDPNEIPADASLYSYELVEVLSKSQAVENTCVVAGCSSQLCISKEEADAGGGISTCEFRDSYACYATASCEPQSTGECGWTLTDELTQCLENPPSLI